MARKHRRRSFHGLTSISLDGIPGLGESVSTTDVLVGAAVGLVGTKVIQALVKLYAPKTMFVGTGLFAPVINETTKLPEPSIASKVLPLVAGIGAGAALYFANDKLMKNTRRGWGHAAGAASVGVALTVSEFVRTVNIPLLKDENKQPIQFGSVVSMDLGYNGFGGTLVQDNSDRLPYSGMLVADRSDSLNELAAYDMGVSDDGDGLEHLGL